MTVSCLVSVINMGVVFSFGSLFIELMDKFQTDRSTTATVQSLLVGVTLSFGEFIFTSILFKSWYSGMIVGMTELVQIYVIKLVQIYVIKLVQLNGSWYVKLGKIIWQLV